MIKYFILWFVFAGLVSSNQMLYGENEAPAQSPPDFIMSVPGELTWVDGPPSLPTGSRITVLEGSPAKAGPFTVRFELPANYKVAPHWHPEVEHVTVLSGALYMGHGANFDTSKAKKLGVGGFIVMAKEVKHFAFTREEGSIIQLHGIGPWGITYVNPADDPRQESPSE